MSRQSIRLFELGPAGSSICGERWATHGPGFERRLRRSIRGKTRLPSSRVISVLEAALFDRVPRIALEEGIAYTLSGGAIIRSTSDDFSSLTSPTWNNQTVGNNFTKLEFTYYDDAGNTVNPQTLALRSTMRRVDFVISAKSSDELTRGPKGSYTVSLSVYPQNLALTGH